MLFFNLQTVLPPSSCTGQLPCKNPAHNPPQAGCLPTATILRNGYLLFRRFYTDEVLHLFEHPHDDGGIFVFHGLVHLVESERVEVPLLTFGSADTAAYLSDFQFCHNAFVLTVKHFTERNAAGLCHGMRIAKFGKRAYGRLHEVVGVGRTLALGEDVLDTHALEHGTHGTAGYHSRTGGQPDAR